MCLVELYLARLGHSCTVWFGLRQKVQIRWEVSSLLSSGVSFLKGSVHSSLTVSALNEADGDLEDLEPDLDLEEAL